MLSPKALTKDWKFSLRLQESVLGISAWADQKVGQLAALNADGSCRRILALEMEITDESYARNQWGKRVMEREESSKAAHRILRHDRVSVRADSRIHSPSSTRRMHCKRAVRKA